ncbi:hypothetical protein FJT64_019375 [Amphibalanus amphitrite]|uniref:DUF5641 domain-containing protein n=1 Tax=Amphibalanus amphitrite TaxID=1232801 RepID=A0A6A4X560_AMPAM|nr:hypothetical protein FJT64_019375 [Amphibalanus amphitrite]
MQDQIFKAKRVLARLERSSEVSVGRAQCVPPYLGGKLDLKLPKFCGDVEKWSEFWSLFCVSVHDNPAYAPVEKLVHLKAHLVDQAEVAVQGLPITDQGYLKAVETLKERFDRPDLCIKVLMQRLLSTTPVHSDNDLVRLRRMIDGLVSEVRALETMNVLPDSYAVLLMPVLLSCIPESWKIEWLRCSADSSDELTVFLKFLQKEMSIREEAAARRKRTTSEQPPTAVPGKPTVSMLNGRMCMGVRSQQHCYVQTALVEVAGPRGVRLVRALIDGGADASFIRASLADQLGLEKVGQGTFACVGFKERVEEAHQYDQLYKVVLWNQVEVNPGLRLVETVFGYVLHGQSPGQQTTRQRHAYRCQLVDVERMWTLDAVGVAAEETAERDPPVPTWNATENSTRAEAEVGLPKMGDVFSEASMDLHKTRMSGDDTEDEKVLGLLWSTRSDRLAVTVPQVTCPGTRTELLSAQAVNRTAWILRFAHNARHQRTERRSGALSPEERREALRFWIRVSQSAAYAPELEALTAGAPLPPNSRLEKVRPRDDDVLTPAHLLFGVTSIRGVLSPSGHELDSLSRRWRHQRLVSEHLVQRWTKEYLQTLRTWSFSRRGRPVRLPEVGEIVLVHAEGPRGRWPLARVVSLLSGADGRARAASIVLRGRLTRRPINKLLRLEASE